MFCCQAEGALREEEEDQRLRAGHGHVWNRRHGHRERTVKCRGVQESEDVRVCSRERSV